MPDPKSSYRPLVLKENGETLNQLALKHLKAAKEHAPEHYLHLLTLAAWGLDQGVSGEWPDKETWALQSQVDGLFGWKPENALAWLLSHPDGPDQAEQERNLQVELRQASSPSQAAALVLSAIWSRQVAGNPALQPAASELAAADPETTDSRDEEELLAHAETRAREAQARWAELHRKYLEANHPRYLAQMQEKGSLEAHLEAKGIEAEQMWEHLAAQMRAAKPPEGETFAERVARFEQIPLIVDEIVLSESVYAL